jgi:hypothetical protein
LDPAACLPGCGGRLKSTWATRRAAHGWGPMWRSEWRSHRRPAAGEEGVRPKSCCPMQSQEEREKKGKAGSKERTKPTLCHADWQGYS